MFNMKFSSLLATAVVAAGSLLSLTASAADGKVKMGFIYVGPKDDYGYNQSHAEGCAAVQKLGWVSAVEEASVPETTVVAETMRDMIEQDDCTVLFPTSFGYFNPYILKMAKEYPKVQFFHCGGMWHEGLPDNVGSYFGYIDEAEYICGIVAAETSKTKKIGFIAAKPIPQVLRNINSYTLGARSVVPDATVQVVFTGDWSLPVKEAEAANSLVDQGCDVLTCHVDSPKVIMITAAKRGVMCTGYHANQSALNPKGYLTGAEWNWSKIYSDYAQWIHDGKSLMAGTIPHLIRGGLKEGFCKVSPYGPMVSDKTKADADAAKAKFMDGTMVIYQGPITDNTGKIVIPAGAEEKQQDINLEKMNYLVAGVIGKTGN